MSHGGLAPNTHTPLLSSPEKPLEPRQASNAAYPDNEGDLESTQAVRFEREGQMTDEEREQRMALEKEEPGYRSFLFSLF